jgi:hypothetical protein
MFSRIAQLVHFNSVTRGPESTEENSSSDGDEDNKRSLVLVDEPDQSHHDKGEKDREDSSDEDEIVEDSEPRYGYSVCRIAVSLLLLRADQLPVALDACVVQSRAVLFRDTTASNSQPVHFVQCQYPLVVLLMTSQN